MSDTFSFLFMPDISGFTDFVHQTEISHSKHIVSELLELLIDSESLGLELAEIEGDALFYYKDSSIPDLPTLSTQIEKMFVNFQNHLKLYETNRICPCGACKSALNLKLKFIAHIGHIEYITVKDHHKPYGEAVIKLHRFLKNDIQSDEYLLISEELKNHYGEVSDFTKMTSTYDFGESHYFFRSLENLYENLSERPKPDEIYADLPQVKKSTIIDKNILDLIDLLLDYEKRPLWNPGPETTGYEKNKVNRVGSQHVCVVGKDDISFKSTTREKNEDELVLGERTLDFPFAHSLTTFYTLKPISQNKTEFKVETYFDIRSWKHKLLLPLIKSRFKKTLEKSMALFKRHA